VILGAGRVEPANVDIGGISAVLFQGEEEIARGEASAVLGNPTKAVAWLARKVASFGVRLEAGHVILPGSCTRAIDARPGDVFRADFSDIGSVSVEFK
jgi:2-keto-4-pentenoate hydratase